jgi:transcriptional regulator with XRE-family HTH domain
MTQTSTTSEVIERAIGAAIRSARLASGLSMTALAEQCGVSQPYLSQLEHGKGSPSINTLYKIANALGVSPQDLLPDETDDVVVIRRGSRPATPIEDRPDAALARVLHGAPEALLQVQEVTVEPDQFLGGYFDHEGEEMLYVLEGSISVEIGARPRSELEAGDAVWYVATLPHRWTRLGDSPARMLVVSAAVPKRLPHT